MDIPNRQLPMNILRDGIRKYSYDASLSHRHVLKVLEQAIGDKIELFDPTNPAVMIMELASVTAADSIEHSTNNLAKIYPSLASTYDHLYRHMADVDYLDRFALPGKTTFRLLIQKHTFRQNRIFNEAKGYYSVIMGRDTRIEIGGFSFSLNYPLEVREYVSGIMHVVYDASIVDPVEPLHTNVIQHVITTDVGGIEWIMINLEVLQIRKQADHFTVIAARPFDEFVTFEDDFHYLRAYHQVNGVWVEMKTTHTDQVFDIDEPTIVLQVEDSEVKLKIPPLYTINGAIDGAIRIVTYTTRGDVITSFDHYTPTDSSVKLEAIDEIQDVSEYSLAFADMSFQCYPVDSLTGGRNGLSFMELKDRMLSNNVGINQLPITSDALRSKLGDLNFGVQLYIDTTTDRVYLVNDTLPPPELLRTITPLNTALTRLISNIEALRNLRYVKDNRNRITLTSSLVYRESSGVIQVMDHDEITTIKSSEPEVIADLINSGRYFYSPFFYVFDNSESTFTARPYQLDKPSVTRVDFRRHNPTTRSYINTEVKAMILRDWGYELLIVTRASDNILEMIDMDVKCQLSIVPLGEVTPVYINSYSVSRSSENELQYNFRLYSNLDINKEHELYLDELNYLGLENTSVKVNLDSRFTLLYAINQDIVDFRRDTMDDEAGQFTLPNRSVKVVTKEHIWIRFGRSLDNLWCKARTLPQNVPMLRHIENVPNLYPKDVFELSPRTDSIVHVDEDDCSTSFRIIHREGDPVLDSNGDPTYIHYKGDVITNQYHVAQTVNNCLVDHAVDIFTLEGSYHFVTDTATLNYVDDIINHIVRRVMVDIGSVEDRILENTEVFYIPKSSIGKTEVSLGDGETAHIEKTQNLQVTLYVEDSLFHNLRARASIERMTTETIVNYLNLTTVSVSDITTGLTEQYSESVISVELSKIDNKYNVVSLLDHSHKLSMAKEMRVASDDTLYIIENIEFKYVNYMSV